LRRKALRLGAGKYRDVLPGFGPQRARDRAAHGTEDEAMHPKRDAPPIGEYCECGCIAVNARVCMAHSEFNIVFHFVSLA
jgi:hypothetical protein